VLRGFLLQGVRLPLVPRRPHRPLLPALQPPGCRDRAPARGPRTARPRARPGPGQSLAPPPPRRPPPRPAPSGPHVLASAALLLGEHGARPELPVPPQQSQQMQQGSQQQQEQDPGHVQGEQGREQQREGGGEAAVRRQEQVQASVEPLLQPGPPLPGPHPPGRVHPGCHEAGHQGRLSIGTPDLRCPWRSCLCIDALQPSSGEASRPGAGRQGAGLVAAFSGQPALGGPGEGRERRGGAAGAAGGASRGGRGGGGRAAGNGSSGADLFQGLSGLEALQSASLAALGPPYGIPAPAPTPLASLSRKAPFLRQRLPGKERGVVPLLPGACSPSAAPGGKQWTVEKSRSVVASLLARAAAQSSAQLAGSGAPEGYQGAPGTASSNWGSLEVGFR